MTAQTPTLHNGEPRKPLVITAEGCIVDESNGIEWAPDSACIDRLTFTQARAAAKACTFAGGGWHVASPKEWMASGISHERFSPASDLPDAKSDWYWTDQVDASSPAGCAIYVSLYYGLVHWGNQDCRGRVRFCRRVRASQF